MDKYISQFALLFVVGVKIGKLRTFMTQRQKIGDMLRRLYCKYTSKSENVQLFTLHGSLFSRYPYSLRARDTLACLSSL